MGWFGNIFLIVGLWMIGNKARWSFLCTAVGESVWTLYASLNKQWDLTFICIVFTVLAIRNYYKWGK